MRSGFSYDIGKVHSPGDLAIFCPTCLQPGINLKDDWQSDPEQYVSLCFTTVV